MTNRIDETFQRLRADGQQAFIAYLCAGDPNLEATVALSLALEKVGVDILELGVPFSDPLADGIVNQLAAQRALEAGTTVAGVFDAVKKIRVHSQIPVVLYTYMNPLYTYGFEQFHLDAAAAGVDGVLILDLPPDESAGELEFTGGTRRIRLIAPTTPPERIQSIVAKAGGFIYYVSREGVTGEQSSVATSIAARVAAIREFTTLPIAVGFGVSKPEHAAEIARMSDGVIVGSAIVKRIAEYGAEADLAEKVADFVRPLVQAIRK
jgi:tryptophan synthase alpha chain